MLRICIVAHFAFGAMKIGFDGHIGGVERQTSIAARWLVKRGHDVSLVTWDEGHEDGLIIDGVRMLNLCGRNDGTPGLRFFYPRWTSLNHAMRRADAQLYYQNCGEYVTGQVAWWCRRNGRRFVYSVASDPDCDPQLPEMRTVRERILYRYGLKHSTRIIVQTKKQKCMLMEGFGLDSVVIPMPCPGPSITEYREKDHSKKNDFRVIWVGRIARVKRLELLLDVAEHLKDIWFDVAGSADQESSYANRILERAAALKNVVLHGRVDWSRMPELYKKASVLCCTSEFEGFPNTFLEAWSYGVPIVSTVDPDDVIEDRAMGCRARDVGELIEGIQKLRMDHRLWQNMSINARRYYDENHAVEPAMIEFERVFLTSLNDKRAITS